MPRLDTENVNSVYGAPMGRKSSPGSLLAHGVKREFLRRVRLNSGGYDRGGAYWGVGMPLWCRWGYSADGDLVCQYFRAPSREAARASK